MNTLNSVLIEGKITDIDKSTTDFPVVCTIEAVRHFKENNDVISQEISRIIIVAYGRLADYLSAYPVGSVIRVVGRLKQVDNSVVVVAEHIERRIGHEENLEI